ncbi:MAG: sigma-70 family RNA polymerase sigma factor [Caldilineae bacterium]|nr:sigma-70 family RNA polymerase sigma factor [Chloroflexota bacterium]MCB9175638.1 sigma-70 family RNA polymerase sigma factor [Caldilineae bacterium]
MSDESAWIAAARAGDDQAFGHLVEAYQRPVFSLAYRMLGSAGDAEDAAQEAFLKAYRALASYDPARPFSTWVLSITAHHCIDRLRRRRMQEISLDGLPAWRAIPANVPDPEQSAERSDRADRVERLLTSLPDTDRLVVVLRYWHDLGYAEIAEVTDTSVSAVKSRLHRARRQLAEVLAQDSDFPHAGSADREQDRKPALAAHTTGGLMRCHAMTLAS